MRQLIGDKKKRSVEQQVNKPIVSMWARGNRNPRFWDVYFVDGNIGRWYPTFKKLEITDQQWENEKS